MTAFRSGVNMERRRGCIEAAQHLVEGWRHGAALSQSFPFPFPFQFKGLFFLFLAIIVKERIQSLHCFFG